MAQNPVTISIRLCHLLAFRPIGVPTTGIDPLLTLFADFGLPARICASDQLDTETLDDLVGKIGPPPARHSRKVLLLCGGFLEEQISVAAQYLLATGYEVYLLRDLIASKNREHAYIHEQRLLHAGAVSTTMRQLSYEWAVSETDAIIRQALSRFSLA